MQDFKRRRKLAMHDHREVTMIGYRAESGGIHSNSRKSKEWSRVTETHYRAKDEYREVVKKRKKARKDARNQKRR